MFILLQNPKSLNVILVPRFSMWSQTVIYVTIVLNFYHLSFAVNLFNEASKNICGEDRIKARLWGGTAFVLRPEPESQICCFNICETGKQNMNRRFTTLNGSPSCLALIRNSGEAFPSRAEQNNSPSHNAPLYSRRRGRIHRSFSAAEQTYRHSYTVQL